MSALFQRQWLLPLGVLMGYSLLMGTNPVRHALLDGIRAIRRYPRLWGIPAALGFCYALFHAGVALFFYRVLPLEQQPAFGWKFSWAIPPWSSHLGEAHTLRDWLTALFEDARWHTDLNALRDGVEGVAGLFDNVVTTFPLSALAALMLLFNWEDHHRTLRNALRKRFGRYAPLVHAGILACAISAIIEPFLFGPSLIYLNRVAPGLLIVRWSALIDWLSSLFAYLFGVGVQVYLILLVYTWLRGLSWTPQHLMDLSIRRFSFVVKWAAVVLAASSLLYHFPRVCALLLLFDHPLLAGRTLLYTDSVARPLLAFFLICFSSVQITLTFHSETLGKAIAQHLQFLRKFAWQFLWFLLVAGIHLLGLALLDRTLRLGFGGDATIAGVIWSLIHPLIGGFLAAWLLSSWVSLYKRCETGRVQTPDWIPF